MDDFLDDLWGFEDDYEVSESCRMDHPYEWKDKGGKLHSVFEMKTSHLKNTVAFLRRLSTTKSKPPVYYSMILELERRGFLQIARPTE